MKRMMTQEECRKAIGTIDKLMETATIEQRFNPSRGQLECTCMLANGFELYAAFRDAELGAVFGSTQEYVAASLRSRAMSYEWYHMIRTEEARGELAPEGAPEVEDCREIARKRGKDAVIILTVDGDGRLEMATFGRNPRLCAVAKKLGDAIEEFVNLAPGAPSGEVRAAPGG